MSSQVLFVLKRCLETYVVEMFML